MAASKKDVAKQQVKEDREKVREMYLSGKTVKEIAKETYFSSSYCYAMVRDLAKEKNLAKKAKRAPLDEAMIQDAKAGMTVAEIAKKHGVTYQQCYYTVSEYAQTSVYKGYKRDKIEMRGDRAEISDFPLYLNTVAGGLDCRDQTIGGFSFVVKIYAVPVIEIIG